MTRCSVKLCGRSSQTSNYTKDGITFHRFPQDPAMKEAWVKVCRRKSTWCPVMRSVVCSRHFNEECFKFMKKRRRLIKSALPTLHLPVPLQSDTENYSEKNNRDRLLKLKPDVVPHIFDKQKNQVNTECDSENINMNAINLKPRKSSRSSIDGRKKSKAEVPPRFYENGEDNVKPADHYYPFATNAQFSSVYMFYRICRVCGQHSTMNRQLSSQWQSALSDDFVAIADDIYALTGVLATESDGGPRVVCLPCCGRVRDAGGLVRDVRDSDLTFRTQLGLQAQHWPRPIQVEKLSVPCTMEMEVKMEPPWEETETPAEDVQISNCDIKVEPEEIQQPDGYYDVPISPQMSSTNSPYRHDIVTNPSPTSMNKLKNILTNSPSNKWNNSPNNKQNSSSEIKETSYSNSPLNLPTSPNNLPASPNNLPASPNNLPASPNNLPASPNNLPSSPQHLPTSPITESSPKAVHSDVNGITQATPPPSHLIETFSQHIEMFDEKIQKVYIPSDVGNTRRSPKIIDVSAVTCGSRKAKEEYSEVEYLECYKCERDEDDVRDLSTMCQLCLREHRTMSGLRAHVITTHTYRRPKRKSIHKRNRHVCRVCRRAFSTPTELMVHSSCHSALCCYSCGTSCDSLKELFRHRHRCQRDNHHDTHTNTNVNKHRKPPNSDKHPKPPTNPSPPSPYQPRSSPTPRPLYSCPLCAADFSDSYYLKIHMEANHQDTVRDVIQSGGFVTCSDQVHTANGHADITNETLETMLEG